MNYFDHYTYLNFSSALNSSLHVADSFTFGTYFFKGLTIGPQCRDWKTYTAATLALPFDDVTFSHISASFEFESFETGGAYEQLTATCAHREIVGNIISSLQTGTEYEGNCNGLTWRVFTCGTTADIVFCVNCKKNCASTESCPGTSFSVNPCTGGSVRLVPPMQPRE